MAGPSVVVSFDSRGLVMGDVTRDGRTVVRQLVRGKDIREDSVIVLMEVDHGAVHIGNIVRGLRSRYAATVETVWDDPDHWRGRAHYQDLQGLRDHPVYGVMLELRKHILRGVLHMESGLSIQRYDLQGVPPDLEERLDKIRTRAREAGIACMARTTTFDQSILHWSPLDDPANRPPT